MAKTAALVVTSCGKRKSLEPHPYLRGSALERAMVADLSRRWLQRLKAAEPRIAARELYQGRAFREAEAAAAAAGGGVYVISAGLGLVCADAKVPSYSLTVAPGSADNVLSRLSEPGEGAAFGWWLQLQKGGAGTSFSDLLRRHDGLILIAAGSAYLKMISSELLALDDPAFASLRLFSGARPNELHERLRSALMPYDGRLETLGAGRAGTLSDFAQRAVRHFAEEILPSLPNGSAAEHVAAVSAALAGKIAPSRRRGLSLSDEKLLDMIRDNWLAAEGRSGVVHRLFRDSLGVACEQNRFRKLFAMVRSERGSE